MARGTRTAVLLLCVLAAILLADARHLLGTEDPLHSAKSAAVQQSSTDVGEIEEVQQLSQLVGDIDSEEGGLELQAALWRRAKKQGKCIFEGKIVECQRGNSYPKEGQDYSEDSRWVPHMRFIPAPSVLHLTSRCWVHHAGFKAATQ